MADKFEVRVKVVKHIATMLLEMAAIEWEEITAAEEAELLEDYEEVAMHILDSLSFSPEDSEDGINIGAKMTLQDPEKYIRDLFEKEGLL